MEKKLWEELNNLKKLIRRKRSVESSRESSPKRQKCRSRRIISSASESSSDEQENEDPNVSNTTDDDPFSILGEDPTTNPEFGDDIHSHLAIRWNNILQKGLKRETRLDLLQKYLPPGNCTFIQPPTLNDEIKAAVNDTSQKRDKKLEEIQAQLGAGITSIGKAVDLALKIPDKQLRDQMIKQLGDSGQILTDLHHLESLTRRSLLLQGLSKTTKESIKDLPRDKYLFGESLAEKLKAVKACSKSAVDLKPKTVKQNVPRNKAVVRYNNTGTLNWRGSSRRMKTTATGEDSHVARPVQPAAATYRERRPAALRRSQAGQPPPRGGQN